MIVKKQLKMYLRNVGRKIQHFPFSQMFLRLINIDKENFTFPCLLCDLEGLELVVVDLLSDSLPLPLLDEPSESEPEPDSLNQSNCVNSMDEIVRRRNGIGNHYVDLCIVSRRL